MTTTATSEQTRSRNMLATGVLALILLVSIGHVFLLDGAKPYILGLPWWAVATAILYYVLTGAVVVFIKILGGD